MKKIAITMLLAGSALLMADGASTYAKCAGCHGKNGEKIALGKSVAITGQDAGETINQLTAYKANGLNKYGMGAIMTAQMKKLSEADIIEVADYIANLK